MGPKTFLLQRNMALKIFGPKIFDNSVHRNIGPNKISEALKRFLQYNILWDHEVVTLGFDNCEHDLEIFLIFGSDVSQIPTL